MSSPPTPARQADRGQVLRYVANGLVATAVHYGVLTFNLKALEMGSAGVANLIAAIFGIATSYLGSRYYVFRSREEPMLRQGAKFAALYASIAVLHGGVLFAWTDLAGFDYRIGFLLATGLQVLLSYWGNKVLVFSR